MKNWRYRIFRKRSFFFFSALLNVSSAVIRHVSVEAKAALAISHKLLMNFDDDDEFYLIRFDCCVSGVGSSGNYTEIFPK